MAECSVSSDDQTSDTDKICPVCLQTFVYPSRLPCSHVFCFLCIKGVVNKNNRCAMCRTTIPDDYLNNPVLVSFDDDPLTTKSPDVYQWFYEGRNGFWQYDLRTSQELEEAHTKGEATCTILVAGFLYVVDFEKMYQFRQNDASRRRKVKREKGGSDASVPRKGVAGIRLNSDSSSETQAPTVVESSGDSSLEIVENQISIIEVSDDDEAVAVVPPRRRSVTRSSSQEDLINMFSSALVLGNDETSTERRNDDNV